MPSKKPLSIDELNKRALAYKESKLGYEAIEVSSEEQEAVEVPVGEIADYSGNVEDYS